MSATDFIARVQGARQRRLAQWFGQRLVQVHHEPAIVSFTFDDFPRSALTTGGKVLAELGLAGTYYASLGLMGQTAPTGKIFQPDDLPLLVAQGHELACHTFDHCHSWDTAPAEFEASVQRNRDAVAKLLPGVTLTSLSYPISSPRPQTKRRTEKYYETARGGGQTFNAGPADANFLKAFFIEQSRDNFPAIQQVIDDNQRAGGWLIFATHDVEESPTRYGCTPRLFEKVVAAAIKAGAVVLPVHQAWQQIQSSQSCACHCH
jgi:peptidoglycan/xylan/chitin deacetylase (PgdA/CDA1 family)